MGLNPSVFLCGAKGSAIMFDPITAIIAGGIGAIGSIGSAAIQSSAAQQAAETGAQAAERAGDIQWQIFQEQQRMQEPWRQAGLGALSQISDLAGDMTLPMMTDPRYMGVQERMLGEFKFDPSDPGYQWRKEQGLEALEKSAAARGGFFSGQTGKELMGYGQGLAAQEYGSAFDRYARQRAMDEAAYASQFAREFGLSQEEFNQLASVAGLGQTATQAVGQAGQTAAGAAGQYGMTAAQLRALAQQGQGTAWGGAATQLANLGMQGVGGYSQYQMLQDALNPYGPMAPYNPQALGPGF